MTKGNVTSLAGSIFISYRRDDTAETAGRIFDWLVREFPTGAVFKDVDSIPMGVDFRDHLKGALAQCRVVLVLVGPKWVSIKDRMGRRRLDSPSDVVRVEVETALSRSDLRVIPVLVSGARMPSAAQVPESLNALCYRNAAEVRRDPDFAHDMSRLISHIKTALQQHLPAEDDPVPEAAPLTAAEADTGMLTTFGGPFLPAPEGHAVPSSPAVPTAAREEGMPPQMPQVELRFHRRCIAGMRGVFQLRATNSDWRPFRAAKLTLRSSSFKPGELELDLFPLLPGEAPFDTFSVTFAEAGTGTIQSCTLRLPGPWGILTAKGRWPGEFPVLSYEAAMMAARHVAPRGRSSVNDEDCLNAYLLNQVQGEFVPIQFETPKISVEALPDVMHDSLLGMEVRKVQISWNEALWFAEYPVRQKDWARFMTGSLALQRAKASKAFLDGEHARCPMHYVDMGEAMAFCQVLNEEAEAAGLTRHGYTYRLPTALEWRVACGFDTLEDSRLNDEAWHGGRGLNSCQPAGLLSPNAAGLYDMRGNVFEWCLPEKPDAGTGYVAGGSWFNSPADRQACRSGQPTPCDRGTRSSRIGFRVVLARQTTAPPRA